MTERPWRTTPCRLHAAIALMRDAAIRETVEKIAQDCESEADDYGQAACDALKHQAKRIRALSSRGEE